MLFAFIFSLKDAGCSMIDYNARVSVTTISKPASPFLCSQQSIEQRESLIGTAPRADVWFLLEYHGRWGKKALEESDIPDEVKTHLNTQLGSIPESRLLLIKQPREENVRGLAFFAAISNSNPPTLYRFQLNDYEELLTFELTSIADRKSEYDDSISSEPVFVNCTNGHRDQCCALHGVGSYWALERQFPGKVWESTHHGGHRFAANLIHFPHGLSYGRLRKENAIDAMQAGMDGRIDLDHFRGRTIYDEPIQAAEILLRKELDLAAIGGVQVSGSDPLDGNRWRVKASAKDREYEITVEQHDTGEQIHLSCGDEKTSPVVEYKILEIKTI